MNYINTTTLIQHSEQQIRSDNPNYSSGTPWKPPEGYAFVFPAPQPAHNAVTQRVQAIAPELTGLGHWEHRWEVVELYATQEGKDAAIAAQLSALKADKWEDIKAERDRRESGGVLVGTKWFHSDSDSRIKWLGLKDQARDVLAAGGTMATLLQKLGQNIPWQTKDGTFALVTCQLTFDVVAATGNYSAALFAAGLAHKAAMEASADPAAYDFSGDWPAMYEAV